MHKLCPEARLCWRHGAKPAETCSREGCNNYAFIQGGECYTHGAKVRKHTCNAEGCSKQVQQGGVCIRHGAKIKTCSQDGCTNNALKGGVCWRHGARKAETCSHEGYAEEATSDDSGQGATAGGDGGLAQTAEPAQDTEATANSTGADEGNIRHAGKNRVPGAVNERDSSHQESTDNARVDSFGGSDGSPSFGDDDEEEEQQTTHCELRQRPDETDVVDLTNEETVNTNEMHADPQSKKRAREGFEALLQENVNIEGKVKENIRYALVRVKQEVTEEANKRAEFAERKAAAAEKEKDEAEKKAMVAAPGERQRLQYERKKPHWNMLRAEYACR